MRFDVASDEFARAGGRSGFGRLHGRSEVRVSPAVSAHKQFCSHWRGRCDRALAES
jgi:hypothetical protein